MDRSQRWARAFEARAREHWTDAELQRVTEGKDLPILPTNSAVLLRLLGLLHRDASMPPPQVRKFLQLNHMLWLLGPPLRELSERFEHLSFVDAGCGLSYLTLSLAWHLERVRGHRIDLLGIDRKQELITSCRTAAARLGLRSKLEFAAAAIEELEIDRTIHAVISLHACDTATDDAIALGLRHRAELIAVAPCCQAELARALADRTDRTDRDPDPLAPLWQTPHLRREAAATITDTLRMLLLRAAGYETRVVEFVPSRHTAKNTLIRAMRRGGPDRAAWHQYLALRDATGGLALRLERAMPLAEVHERVNAPAQ